MTTPNADAQKLSDDEAAKELERAKHEWLSRYKSREGRAIARRAWERCAEVHARQQPAPGEMILAITDGPIVSENITIDQRYEFQKEIATIKAERDRLREAGEEVLRVLANRFDSPSLNGATAKLRAALKGERLRRSKEI